MRLRSRMMENVINSTGVRKSNSGRKMNRVKNRSDVDVLFKINR